MQGNPFANGQVVSMLAFYYDNSSSNLAKLFYEIKHYDWMLQVV